jgi:uncharacterized DUF497 family protein
MPPGSLPLPVPADPGVGGREESSTGTVMPGARRRRRTEKAARTRRGNVKADLSVQDARPHGHVESAPLRSAWVVAAEMCKVPCSFCHISFLTCCGTKCHNRTHSMLALVITSLIWDDWNTAHIAGHNVTPAEVEAVCAGKHIVRRSYDNRFLVIGYTSKQRPLLVVLDPEPQEGVFYPVTARTADRKERQWYDEEIEGGEAA